MPEHTLNYSLIVDAPRKVVFEFFTDAGNLGWLTPPELEFEFLTPLPIEMKVGAIINYRLKLFGVPFTWKAKITEWSPPDFFVDEQLEGPYRQWTHRHTFRDGSDGTTIIGDEVRYRLPLFGEAVSPMVRKELERIFTYRQEAVKARFGKRSSTA